MRLLFYHTFGYRPSPPPRSKPDAQSTAATHLGLAGLQVANEASHCPEPDVTSQSVEYHLPAHSILCCHTPAFRYAPARRARSFHHAVFASKSHQMAHKVIRLRHVYEKRADQHSVLLSMY